MDANLYIKSFKTEGNRITDIKFFGDWGIDVGNTGGPVEVEYEAIDMMKSGLMPYGVTVSTRQGSTSAYRVYSFENASDIRYVLRTSSNNQGKSYYLDPGTVLDVELNILTNAWSFFLLTEDLKTIAGYIYTSV